MYLRMLTPSGRDSVAYKKLPSHQLVKTGIYAWSRHPSYAGFVWWALGTQVGLTVLAWSEVTAKALGTPALSIPDHAR